MGKSTTKRGRGKAGPAKPKDPFPGFPLGASTAGWWVKRIRGKLHYFGRWYKKARDGKIEREPDDGWQKALELYNAQKEDLHAGRTPRVNKVGEGLTLDVLCNHFLTAKMRKLKAGEITAPTFEGHKQVTDLLIAQFGKVKLVDDITADDFGRLRAVMAERWGPVKLSNQVQAVKSVFKFGYEAGLIVAPVRYGPEFVKPSAAVLRKHKAKNGGRMIEAAELRRLLTALEGKEIETGRTGEETGKPEVVKLAPNPVMRAMVLLGINCGFTNKDVADLPLDALDLDGGWINFPRPKTGIPRRCPLWPETVAALREALAVRPEPREQAAEPLVFVTTRGRPWLSRGQANPVSVVARDAMKAVGIHREKIGFATLRHVFRTIADGSRDERATDYIMGHCRSDVASVHYVEHIDDARLRAVADHVRKWLFGNEVQ